MNMDKKLLASFILNKTNETFNVYGDYQINTNEAVDMMSEELNRIWYKYPEFTDITTTKITGVEQTYIPAGQSWAGIRYTPVDVLEFFISALIRADETYSKTYLEEGLQKFVDEYLKESEIAVTVNGKPVPKRILVKDMYQLYQLALVTDTNIYYVYEDAVFMLSTEDHSVISDNYFAEVGYFESIENIQSGKETCLWGKLPAE